MAGDDGRCVGIGCSKKASESNRRDSEKVPYNDGTRQSLPRLPPEEQTHHRSLVAAQQPLGWVAGDRQLAAQSIWPFDSNCAIRLENTTGARTYGWPVTFIDEHVEIFRHQSLVCCPKVKCSKRDLAPTFARNFQIFNLHQNYVAESPCN